MRVRNELQKILISGEVLGEKAEGFERDLRVRLSDLSPEERFEDEIEYSVISAKRR